MDADIEDLVGPGPGRPRGPRPIGPLSNHARVHSALKERQTLDEKIAEKRRDREEQSGNPSMLITDVHAGVSVGWLSQVFGMDPATVRKRLAEAPVLHRRKAGYVYDLKIAAAYLVKPVFDVKKYLKDMKPSELPSQLQKEYWDAALKRQKWEENAGDLWRSDKVLEVLSDTFKMIKTTMQLWTEDLERETGLTEDQRTSLVQYVDTLQNEINQGLVNAAKNRTTLPQTAEVEIDDPFRAPEEDLVG